MPGGAVFGAAIFGVSQLGVAQATNIVLRPIEGKLIYSSLGRNTVTASYGKSYILVTPSERVENHLYPVSELRVKPLNESISWEAWNHFGEIYTPKNNGMDKLVFKKKLISYSPTKHLQ